MDALISDLWCRIYLAGFLVGAAAFPFLLKRFRDVAAESACDEASPGGGHEDAVEPIKVMAPKAERAAKLAEFEEGIVGAAPLHSPPSGAWHDKSEPAPGQAPKQDGKSSAAGRSPAVVYLQNLKTQMEHFENEVHSLRGELAGMTQRYDNQFDSLLKRLVELQKEVRQPAPAPAPAPAPFISQPALQGTSQAPILQTPAQTAHPVQQAPSAAPVAQVAPAAQAAPAAQTQPKAVGLMRTGGSLLPIRGKIVTPPPAQEPAPDASTAEMTQPIELGTSPGVPAPAEEPSPSANPDDTLILKPNEEFPRTKGRGPVWPV